jgi:hypothetical protein
MATSDSDRRHRGTAALTRLHHLRALLELIESIGAPCWAYGPTAAALLGFDGFLLLPPFHVVVPYGRAVSRHGHVIHRCRDISRLDVTVIDGIASTSATRTLIDLASSESPKRLAAAIDSALRDGLTSESFLHARIVELRKKGRAGLRALLSVLGGAECTRGGHSWLERRFCELLVEAGLPLPSMQQVVGKRGQHLIRVDCRYPGTRIVVELLGYQFHRSPLQMQADVERMNRMVLDGLHPLQFTYTDVVTGCGDRLDELREALACADRSLFNAV